MLEGEKKCTYSKKKFIAGEVLRGWKKEDKQTKLIAGLQVMSCWLCLGVRTKAFFSSGN